MVRRRGFTLIELVVVMVVASIVASIGFFTLSSMREGTDLTSAQTSVRAVALAQQRQWGREQAFADAGELSSMDSKYTYRDAAAASGGYQEVSVDAAAEHDGAEAVVLAAAEQDQCAFAVVVDPQVGDPVTGSFTVGSGRTCSAQAVPSHLGEGAWKL